MCRKIIGGLLIIAVSLCVKATAQQYAFQITFTDKHNTPYSFSSPLAYLSSRALQRRTNQGIALDSTDFPVNPNYIDSVLTLTGGKYHETSRWLNMLILLTERADSAQILNLSGKSFISDVKLVGQYTFDLHRHAATNTGNTRRPATTQRIANADGTYYSNTWVQTQLVNGNYLHDNGYNGDNMMIAVLDAGFTGTDTHSGFDSMRQSGRLIDTYNFVTDNSSVYLSDDHGTEVLSTMAGYVPDTFVGSAPLAMYALYVTEIDSSDQPLELDNMLTATERADSMGVDVITESLGYDLFANPADGQTFSELDGKTTIGAKAANIATQKGMLFVATAGNDGSPPVPGWGNHILTPGDADSALTIGAVDYSGTLATFSGYGPNAAGQIKPDVCAMGVSTSVFDAIYGGYITNNGTSFSTPQVAGWAACLWECNRNASPFALRQAIKQCASSYSSPTNPQLGYGIPNFECTEQTLNVLDTPLPFSKAEWVFATPNPFSNELKVSAAPFADGNVKFDLFDISGRIVLESQQYFYSGYNAPFYITIPELPAGVYVLKVVSAMQEQVIKLEKR